MWIYTDKPCYLPKDAPIIVSYYSLKIGIGNDSVQFVGQDYRAVVASLEESGFTNVQTEVINTGWAIMALTNASASLQASLVYEINSICDKYDAEKGRFVGIKTEKLKEKMYLINSSFQTIHKATTLKAAIYYKEGEYQSLTTVLSDYKVFLERSLPEDKAHILYLADPNEKTFEGIWNIRRNELPVRIDNTRELLMQPQNYLLEMAKEEFSA